MNLTENCRGVRGRASQLALAEGRQDADRVDWLCSLLERGESCVGGHIAMSIVAGDGRLLEALQQRSSEGIFIGDAASRSLATSKML
jgi:hypothetical protein